jgi:hypothetical protein
MRFERREKRGVRSQRQSDQRHCVGKRIFQMRCSNNRSNASVLHYSNFRRVGVYARLSIVKTLGASMPYVGLALLATFLVRRGRISALSGCVAERPSGLKT